jgi:hypothetical protein
VSMSLENKKLRLSPPVPTCAAVGEYALEPADQVV